MFCQTLKNVLNDALSTVESNINSYVAVTGKDFSRVQKISPSMLMSFLISQGGSSTKNECIDFFKLNADAPSASALNQRRAQLKPEALKKVFDLFTENVQKININSNPVISDDQVSNDPVSSTPPADSPSRRSYSYIAADGTTITFFSFPKYAGDDYYVSEGHSARGFYSMHINALYNLEQRIYTDAYIQPVHNKDEFYAFCQLVDRQKIPSDTDYVFIGDRGYCSYNNMAHVQEKKQFFLFRTKDKEKKGLIGKFDFPDAQEFDIDVKVTLTRSHSKSIAIPEGHYRRFVDAATSFDYVEYGSDKTYDLSFRVVRFPIKSDRYECIVTNLPKDEFPPEKIKDLYNSRWGIESSFRKLKYTIGMSNYHSYKPEFIEQEIWAKMIAYNATELIINHACIEKADRKHDYKINFSVAAHICRIYICLLAEIDSIDVMALIMKELIPIRSNRQFPRSTTAHFRKPKYLIYRVS